MTFRGILSGSLALILLEAVLRSTESADRAGGLLVSIGNVVEAVLSPAVPAIPDLTA